MVRLCTLWNFAPVFAALFFPSNSPSVSLISAFGVFAVGFLARPLGAMLFGYWGDTLGRRNALAWLSFYGYSDLPGGAFADVRQHRGDRPDSPDALPVSPRIIGRRRIYRVRHVSRRTCVRFATRLCRELGRLECPDWRTVRIRRGGAVASKLADEHSVSGAGGFPS